MYRHLVRSWKCLIEPPFPSSDMMRVFSNQQFTKHYHSVTYIYYVFNALGYFSLHHFLSHTNSTYFHIVAHFLH